MKYHKIIKRDNNYNVFTGKRINDYRTFFPSKVVPAAAGAHILSVNPFD